jgi:hypothetical protein
MYFHNGNHIKTTQFHDHECLKEFVHVANLSSGEYLFSEHPFLLIKDNGVAIIIDSSLTKINHYNHEHVLIESYNLEFITQCHEIIDDSIPSQEDHPVSLSIISFISIFIIALVVVIARRFV